MPHQGAMSVTQNDLGVLIDLDKVRAFLKPANDFLIASIILTK